MAQEPEEALRNYFLGEADIQDIVDGRVRTGRAGTTDQRPFLVIEPPRIDTPQHTGGAIGLSETLITLKCDGNTYGEARALATAVYAKFKAGYQGLMGQLQVRNIIPVIRGRTPGSAGGKHDFHSIEVRLTMFHE